MKKTLGFAVGVIVWLHMSGAAWGIRLFDGDLNVSGFGRSQWSIATDGGLSKHRAFSGGYDQGDLAWNRWTAQLEVDYRPRAVAEQLPLFRNLGVFAIGRYHRMTETEISDSNPDPKDFGRSRSGIKTFNRDDHFEEFDLREIYLYTDIPNMPGGDATVFIGRQQAIWGESDGFRLADIANPLDLSWHFFLEDFEDIRETIPMARIFYYPDFARTWNGRVEFLWIFGKFEATDFGPVYCNIDAAAPGVPGAFDATPGDGLACPPAGAVEAGAGTVFPGGYWNFGFDQRTLNFGTSLALDIDGDGDIDFVPGRDNRPDGMSGAGEAAVRVTFNPKNVPLVGDYEISIYDFYTHYDFPTFNIRVAPDLQPDGGILLQPQFSYPSQNVIGVTWNRFYEDLLFLWQDANVVFRGEATYTNKFPFTGLDSSIVFHDTAKWVLGLDRPTYMPQWADIPRMLGISPAGRTTFLSVQWFATWVISNHKTGETNSEIGPRSLPHILTFFAQQRWLAGEELQPQIFIAYEEPQGNILIQPAVNFRFPGQWGNFLTFNVTYNWFETFSNSNRRDGFFGPFLQRDELVGRVAFSF